LIRVILFAAVIFLVFYTFKLVKLLSQYRSGSRPSNIDDLKNRAEHLKNKYKNVEEADYRDITSSEDESDSSKENNG
jgi:CRISPR/Cas system-associated endonuclease Cas3-HD